MPEFVSRAGQKLEHAIATFNMNVAGLTCADLGSNTGGFTDCLLQRGATKVYAVDTGYGVLDWKLRKDPRVVVMERTNAMHASLPEPVGFICIDVAWTRQKNILPAAKKLLAPAAEIVSLVKPHYESHASILRQGILPEERLDEVLASVSQDIANAGFIVVETVRSPIKGAKGNVEMLYRLARRASED